MVKKIYSLKNKFSFVDKNFAHTILSKEFPEAYKHLIEFCSQFKLFRSEMELPGGNESSIPRKTKDFFMEKDWVCEKNLRYLLLSMANHLKTVVPIK